MRIWLVVLLLTVGLGIQPAAAHPSLGTHDTPLFIDHETHVFIPSIASHPAFMLNPLTALTSVTVTALGNWICSLSRFPLPGPVLRLLPRALLAIVAMIGALWWLTLGRKKQRERMNALDEENSRDHWE